MKYAIPSYGKYRLLQDFKLDSKQGRRTTYSWRYDGIRGLATSLIPYGFETDVDISEVFHRDGSRNKTPSYVIFPAGMIICIDKIEVNKRNGNCSLHISLPTKDNANISKKAKTEQIFAPYVDASKLDKVKDDFDRYFNMELALNTLDGIDMEPLEDED